MKIKTLPLLLVITLLFLTFTLGFFLGRNRNHETIHLSVIPTQAMHDLPPEEASDTEEETHPEIQFPVNINTAGIRELSALPGIGEVLARRILDFRDKNGSFSRPEELLNVEGIGVGKLEEILDYVITGG